MNKDSWKTFKEFIRTADRSNEPLGHTPMEANPVAGRHKNRNTVTPKVNPTRSMALDKARRNEYRLGYRPGLPLQRAESTILPEEWPSMTPEKLSELFWERAGVRLSGNPVIISRRIEEINSGLTPELHEAPTEPDIANEVDEEGEPGTLRSSSIHEDLINEKKEYDI